MNEIDRIQNAIRHIKTSVDIDPWAMEIAVEAMEKQIQKKPMISINVYNENICHLYCPTCGTWIGVMNKRLKGINMHNNENGNICAKCGQVIDTDFERWEDDQRRSNKDP